MTIIPNKDIRMNCRKKRANRNANRRTIVGKRMTNQRRVRAEIIMCASTLGRFQNIEIAFKVEQRDAPWSQFHIPPATTSLG